MAECSNEVETLLAPAPTHTHSHPEKAHSAATVWWESFKKTVVFTWRFHHILTTADKFTRDTATATAGANRQPRSSVFVELTSPEANPPEPLGGATQMAFLWRLPLEHSGMRGADNLSALPRKTRSAWEMTLGSELLSPPPSCSRSPF